MFKIRYKMKKQIFLVLFLFLALSTVVSAQNQMKLLAVQEGNTTVGSTADLYLESQNGSGRVFLDTYPVTKADTQISTRFAKEIACNYFDIECNHQDYIYTIRAQSNIIGGPSAGAATAALTTANVLDLPVDQSVTVTGTINSGGLIGPVGGLKEKINAASRSTQIDTVLIPFGTKESNRNTIQENKNNQTSNNESINLIDYGEENGVNVKEVKNLNQVVKHLTGEKLLTNNNTITASSEYQDIMKTVGEDLCKRTERLKSELNTEEVNQTFLDNIQNRTNDAEKALNNKRYYSASSYCFGANIDLHEKIYEQRNLSEEEIKNIKSSVQEKIDNLTNNVKSKDIETINDLQAYTVVIERINEAQQFLDRLEKNGSNTNRLIAFSKERLTSAEMWIRFFKMEGKNYELNDDILEQSCNQKVREAQERLQYVKLYLPTVTDISREVKRSEKYRNQGKYELCLIKASQAKGQANSILSSIGVKEKYLEELVDSKINAVETVISRNIEERAFPILGFSYYEYTKELREDQPRSALLYSEYALELSNLNIYFDESKKDDTSVSKTKERTNLDKTIKVIKNTDKENTIYLLVGILIGLILTSAIFKMNN